MPPVVKDPKPRTDTDQAIPGMLSSICAGVGGYLSSSKTKKKPEPASDVNLMETDPPDQIHKSDVEPSRIIEEYKLEIGRLERYLGASESRRRTYKEQAREAGALRAQLRKGNKELARRHNDIQELEAELNKRDATIRKLQASTLAQVDPAEWKPEEDSVVASAFRDLDKALQRWAKSFCIKSVSPILELPAEERFHRLQAFSGFMWLNQDGSWPQALEHTKLAEKLSSMLVQACANHFLYEAIIGDPFFFLDKQGDDYGYERFDQHADTMCIHHLLHDLAQNDAKQAAYWRSDLLRMLMPPNDAESTTTALSMRAKTIENVKAACTRTAQGIIHEIEDLLIPGRYSQSLKELVSICTSAGELSYKLWARRNTIAIFHLPAGNCMLYNPKSDIMDHHPLHNNEYESNPSSLEGKQVNIMLSPGIAVYGRGDGEDFDTRRVWKTCIAFMELPDTEGKPIDADVGD